MPVLVPPRAEQAAIARFLSYVDLQIQRCVRSTKKLIKLLEEQKQALINRAVTCGLNPNFHFKPSGLEWLGEVPRHWKLVRLKNVATVQTGLTLGKNYGSATTKLYPYLRVANVQTGRADLRTIKEINVPESEALGCLLKPGDVLMTEGGDIDKLGRGCVWNDEITNCLHQNHVFAVRCGTLLLPEFLVVLLASGHGRSYFQRTAKQTTNLAATNSTTLKEFPVPLPSVDEQRRILLSITAETRDIDRTKSDAEQKISLLREYRARLIADVVTGKLDVREIAARLTDEREDSSTLDQEEAELSGVEGQDDIEEALEPVEA
jgi:type I restriction enzyme S subunit